MQKIRLKIIMLLTLLLLVIPIIQVKAEESQPYSLKIQRVIGVSDYGVVVVNDTFVLVNANDKPIENISIGILKNYEKNIKYIMANDTQKRYLKIDTKEENSITWFIFEFPKPILQKEEYRFSSIMVLSDLLKMKDRNFVFNFSASPILKTKAEFYNITIVLLPGSSIFLPENSKFNSTEYYGRPAVSHLFKPLEAYYNETVYFEFSSVTQYLLRCNSLERDITIGQDGSLYVSDVYRFTNYAIPIYSLPIKLIDNATNVMVYDSGGSLLEEPTSGSEIVVSPRYYSIRGGENYTFKIDYKIPQSNHIKQINWWGLYNFSLELFPKSPWVIEHLKVTIIMPKGAEIYSKALSLNETKNSSIFYKKITFELNGMTNFHDSRSSFIYKSPLFLASLKPLVWASILEVLIIFAYMLIRVGKPPIPVIPIPVELIKGFITLYDEKTALKTELEQINEKVKRKAISKHEFRHKRKLIDTRLSEINKLLTLTKEKLKEVDARYNEMLKKIDRSEAEIEALTSSMVQVESQYSTGKITKDV
ncbi:MAG: hypothetical protein QW589_06385, partial [Candidatus Bathyarchaeia archaeon]